MLSFLRGKKDASPTPAATAAGTATSTATSNNNASAPQLDRAPGTSTSIKQSVSTDITNPAKDNKDIKDNNNLSVKPTDASATPMESHIVDPSSYNNKTCMFVSLNMCRLTVISYRQ